MNQPLNHNITDVHNMTLYGEFIYILSTLNKINICRNRNLELKNNKHNSAVLHAFCFLF